MEKVKTREREGGLGNEMKRLKARERERHS